MTVTVRQNGAERIIQAAERQTFFEVLAEAGITGLHTPCGGKGLCKQCGIIVSGRVRTTGGDTEMDANSEKLLACRAMPCGDCDITLPDTAALNVVTTGAGDISPCGEGLGVAVDIGTTTVAAFLYDMKTGRRLSVASDRNAQRPYGADVISRIQLCTSGGLMRLAEVIRTQLSELIDTMCEKTGRSRADINLVTIAGNTVMEHIFAGLDPTSIGVSPFTPLSLFGDMRPAKGVLPRLSENAQIYICPALAGYVGGDITAGLYSSGASESEGLCLFIDIGTNGEMGLGGRAGFICCATAAGPAFEGAEIECGMDGSEGAISKVRYENGRVEFDVIGGVEAKGICGSGLVDALAVMLRCGAVEESGRMLPPDEAPENIAHMLRPTAEGAGRFYLTDKVFVSAADVRQLQLAKSAIRAGIETLLELAGKSCAEVSRLLIAGGFGAFMDVESACAIGLLPPALRDRTTHVGNSAGAGAALALTEEGRRAIAELTKLCDYHELSSSRLFMDKYIECMIFDEYEEV